MARQVGAGRSVHWQEAQRFLVFPLSVPWLFTPVAGSVPTEARAFCPAWHNKARFARACDMLGP